MSAAAGGGSTVSRASSDALSDSDEARRDFAALWLAIDDDPGSDAYCSLPSWSRPFMSNLLLLPAAHPAAKTNHRHGPMDAAGGIPDQSRDENDDAPAMTDVDEQKNNGLGDADGLIALPATPVTFCGPFAFATPQDLRHAVLPGAYLRAQFHHLRHSFSQSKYDLGFCLLHDVIEAISGRLWRPEMAPWALALAQSCGGLTPLNTDPPESPLGHTATPYCLLFRAACRLPALAHARLDVPPGDL
jgi:hypothetical protein